MGIGRTLYSQAGRFLLKCKGVSSGAGLVLHGLPRINRATRSTIILGNRVALCSSPSGNPLGVNHAVILSTIRPGSSIRIGDHTGLSGAGICAAQSVTIGQYCLIGANVTITDYDFHAVKPENRRYNTRAEDIGCAPVVIEDNVWIGMNSIILKGVTIGRNTVIAAGSVVTGPIPANCLAGGNPAKVITSLS
jgi:acetyltransferase-like isoleucine patch superfamily enzyme